MTETRPSLESLREKAAKQEDFLKNQAVPAYIYYLLVLQLKVDLGINKTPMVDFRKNNIPVIQRLEKEPYDYKTILAQLPRLALQLQENISDMAKLEQQSLEAALEEKSFLVAPRTDLAYPDEGSQPIQIPKTSHYYTLDQLRSLTIEHFQLLHAIHSERPSSDSKPDVLHHGMDPSRFAPGRKLEETLKDIVDFLQTDTFKQAIAQQFLAQVKGLDLIFARLMKTDADLYLFYCTYIQPLGVAFTDYLLLLTRYILANKPTIDEPLTKLNDLYSVIDIKQLNSLLEKIQPSPSIEDMDFLKLSNMRHPKKMSLSQKELEEYTQQYIRACTGPSTPQKLAIRKLIVGFVLEYQFTLLRDKYAFVRELFTHSIKEELQKTLAKDYTTALEEHKELESPNMLYNKYVPTLIKLSDDFRERIDKSEEGSKGKPRRIDKLNAINTIRKAFAANNFAGLENNIEKTCPLAFSRDKIFKEKKITALLKSMKKDFPEISQFKAPTSPPSTASTTSTILSPDLSSPSVIVTLK